MLGKCSLCLGTKQLTESHIIPKFVGKWLKATSATGFMTDAQNPKERVQDLPTLPLLCSDCEERFSRLETYFANEIFRPFHEKKIRAFEYDARLQSFVISLSWRILKASYTEVKQEAPHYSSFLDDAEADWRDFLLGRREHIDPYENHIFFLDGEAEGQVPNKFEWYTLRAADTCLAGDEKRVFAYTKLPGMILAASIHPMHLEGWEGTLIKENGKISVPQVIEDDYLGKFLTSRVAIIDGVLSEPSSEVIGKRVVKTMAKNPQRFIESDSFLAMVAERERIRTKKIQELPDNVKDLVTVITSGAGDKPRTKLENRGDTLRAQMVADALSQMKPGEALELDGKIQATIAESSKNNDDTAGTMETDLIMVTFMVNLRSTKDDQRLKVEAEVNRMKTIRGSRSVPIVVISMAVVGDGLNFETGVLMD